MSALHLLWIIPASGSFGAAMMALVIGGAREDRKMEHCATCKHYPKPDGIAHLCEYWGKLTNERGFCSNWRER